MDANTILGVLGLVSVVMANITTIAFFHSRANGNGKTGP